MRREILSKSICSTLCSEVCDTFAKNARNLGHISFPQLEIEFFIILHIITQQPEDNPR